MKLARVSNPRTTHGNTLVMRSSAAPLPVLGPGFTSTEVVYGVTGTEVTELPEYGVSP